MKMFQRTRVLRARDFVRAGIAREHLSRLVADGVLVRPGRGLYVLSDDAPTEHRSLVEATRLVPSGVICLLSALQFHGLTTQAPFEVWLAIDHKARMPKSESPSLRIVRFTGLALSYGIEEHILEGARVRVYSVAKTVTDCFKFRNKIGLDVAIEALRDCLRQKKANRDELWDAAKVCRMTNVMQPYLEATV
ncbi:MAG: hypothetical protein RLZZ232_2636 [Planctomycetota bacterium]